MAEPFIIAENLKYSYTDEDGNASFDVLQIKGKRVTVETYEVLDGNGNFKRL